MMNYLIEKTFQNRGYSPEYISDIERDMFEPFKGEDEACRRLCEIRACGGLVVVLPDFDTDGICSGVVGLAGLSELGFNAALFMPDPKEGYEFTPVTISRLVAQYPDVHTIITCDVGISCNEGIDHAHSLGVQVIVTDHHIQQGPSHADCVVDPMRMDETELEQPYVCGAYVLYHVLQTFANMYEDGFVREQMRRLRVFAGIGTISDLMPLQYCNRQLVRDSVGISRLIYSDGNDLIVNSILGTPVYRRAFYGLFVMYKTFSGYNSLSGSKAITETFYGYYLAPAFNSLKRMDGDMSEVFGLFFGPDPEMNARNLCELNNARKKEVEEQMAIMDSMDQPFAPYVYFSQARSGIVGLMATKVLNRTGEPVIVLSSNGRTGSGRSPEWYPCFDRVSSAGFYIGGHNHSFGIGFTDLKEIKAFHAFIAKDASDVKSGITFEEFVPDFVISPYGNDADTGIDIMLFSEYLYDLEAYRPFGKGFMNPQIRFVFCQGDFRMSLIGSEKQHVKLTFDYGFSVLLWNHAFRKDDFLNGNKFSVLGHLDINEYNGVKSIQFIGDLEAVTS